MPRKIGLVDVDGHRFPNLALMRISAWHKKIGDSVEWWSPKEVHYDRVYMSKIFSDDYSNQPEDPGNTDEIIKGGTGYCISLSNGREVFDKHKDTPLPDEMEKMFPDYSIYPQYNFAVAMTSRGCPRGCPWCHVGAKEGARSVKVANLSDFYSGQKHVEVLDPNITACKDKRELFSQYKDICKPRTGATIDFDQGLDIRLVDHYDLDDINHMRIKTVHFAWDNPRENLEPKFAEWARGFRRTAHIGTVYCLTNFNSTMGENLYRIYTLRDLGFDPYVMIYDKPHAPSELIRLQRWCNNKVVFKSCRWFRDYTA